MQLREFAKIFVFLIHYVFAKIQIRTAGEMRRFRQSGLMPNDFWTSNFDADLGPEPEWMKNLRESVTVEVNQTAFSIDDQKTASKFADCCLLARSKQCQKACFVVRTMDILSYFVSNPSTIVPDIFGILNSIRV